MIATQSILIKGKKYNVKNQMLTFAWRNNNDMLTFKDDNGQNVFVFEPEITIYNRTL